MLGFFRRYEKTFLLLIFAPALLSLGITTAVLDIASQQDDQVVGTVFGEEITRSAFEKVAEPYRRVNNYADDEMIWRFFTLWKAAQRAGLAVTEEEVGERLASQKRFDIAKYLAEQELVAEGVVPGSPEYQQKFGQIILKHLTEAEFKPELYEKTIPAGMTVREYEQHEMREALVSRYLDTLRELATVTPDEVWKEYQEQHHRRAVELVEVLARDHSPDVAAVDTNDPHFISEQQLEAHYMARQLDYEEPRRVKLELLALPLEKLEVAEPTPDEAAAYFQGRRADIAGVTSQTAWGDLTDAQRDQAIDMLEDERRLAKADAIMNEVASLVAAAEAKKEPVDLGAIETAAEARTGAALERKVTDLALRDAIAADELIGSEAAAFWFDNREAGEVSDVLAGPKAWFVLRTIEVKPTRMPSFADVKDRVRQDYARGSEEEQKLYYEEQKATRFLGDASYELEAWVVDSADFGGDAEAAKKMLQAAVDYAHEAGWERGFALNKVNTAPPERVEKASLIAVEAFENKAIDRTTLGEHPILGQAADQVASYEPGVLPREVWARKDGKGWVTFRVKARVPAQAKPFEAVREQVAEAVRVQRGVERAEAWAEKLVAEVGGESPDAARELLKKKGLEPRKTQPFGRDATSIEGFPDAGRIVAEAYSSEAKVGGGFSRVVALPTHPDGARVVVLRVAERVDAGAEEFSNAYAALRTDVLRRRRGEYASEQTRQTFLRAKGITDECLAYVASLRDGPGGAPMRVRARQIFIPPAHDVVDEWLQAQAMERVRAAQADLAAGRSWEAVVQKHTEDDATRSRNGDLPPVARGMLVEDFGPEFDELAFGLSPGQVSAPVKSKRGWHLVRRGSDRDGRTVFSHVLIKTDEVTRKLPAEIKQKAEAASRAKAEEALRQLAEGQPFATVAESHGDDRDPIGKGQPFEMDYVTPFELVALGQPLEWEPAEGSPEAEDMTWMPEAVEVIGPKGEKEWHLFACARDPYDRGSPGETTRRDRQAFHIVAPTQDAIEKVRGLMLEWLKERIEKDEDRPSFAAIVDHLKSLAREGHSRAPNKDKGGAVGILQLEGDVRSYGDAFLSAACRKADGTPVTAGHRSAIVQSEKGFHIIEVMEVIPAGADRQGQVAELLLRGTDWR